MPPRGGRGGGRGGFRGGKSGGGGPPNAQWDYDPEFQPDYKPTELFPPVDQYAPSYMTRRERLQVARYRAFRDRVHEGPLYTVLSETKQAGKQADPFEGMPTYTQKYQKRTRRLPKLDTRPYVLEFFPHELWSTLDPDHEKDQQLAPHEVSANKKRKTLTFARDDAAKALREAEAARAEMADESAREKLDGKQAGDAGAGAGADGDDAGGDNDGKDDLDGDDDERGPAEEELDDDFEEDEDETGDDYNAQQHYEDADYDDDDGGGGGGGDDDFGQME